MSSIALPERVLRPARELLVEAGVELAERALLPDALLRVAIRRFVRDRLVEEGRRSCPTADFAQALATMPLAVATEAANEQHYEVPADFFVRVLGPRLKYSCGFWPSPGTSLAESEEAMLELTLERARIDEGMDVLDLGCGWGSFSLWLAERQPRTRITAVSNSASQRKFILARAAERGLLNLEVLTADVRSLSFAPASFDRVVSVEMFEHLRNYGLLFQRIHRWLRTDGELFAHVFCHLRHAYTYDEAGASSWMAREFFTGGTMPSADLFWHFQEHLRVDRSWWLDGTHYSRTAEAWLRNADAAEEELRELFARSGAGADAARMLQRWRLFFLAVSEMFAYGGGGEWGIGHYRFVRG